MRVDCPYYDVNNCSADCMYWKVCEGKVYSEKLAEVENFEGE